MTRRRQPHHKLSAIKAAFSDPARINRTMTAASGAEDLGMDEQAVVDAVAGLLLHDFDKSIVDED